MLKSLSLPMTAIVAALFASSSVTGSLAARAREAVSLPSEVRISSTNQGSPPLTAKTGPDLVYVANGATWARGLGGGSFLNRFSHKGCWSGDV